MEYYPYPVTVTGNWGSNPPKGIENKLQIYFQSKKKSGGGDCHVEFTGGKVTVRFKSENDRERVLEKEDHELAVAGEVKLRLSRCGENPEEEIPGSGVDDSKTAESGLLKQPGLMADRVEVSRDKAEQAFHDALSRYGCMEFPVSTGVWERQPLELQPELRGFLSAAVCQELSSRLLIPAGISAVYQLGEEGPVLLGASQEALSEAGRRLTDFLREHSHAEETVPLRSIGTLVFLRDHKAPVWRKQAEAEGVNVCFIKEDRLGPPRVVLAGAWLQVQHLKSLFSQLDSALFTNRLSIVKPGARKYFLKEKLSSVLMKEKGCLVLVQEEGKQEEEEEEVGCAVCIQVETPSGVQVTVGRADLTSFTVDAVVNAANERLQHGGGLARALVRAAGWELQEVSNVYVRDHGPLCPGDAVVTAAGRLPCKLVVHAVGPRYSAADPARSVQLLSRAVGHSLALAENHGCISIAVPAISSGIFGFPLQLCAETIAKAVREHCQERRPASSSLAKIHLLNNDHGTVQAMAQAVRTVFADMCPQTLSLPRTSLMPEQKSRRTALRAGEWYGLPERRSAVQNWDKTSERGGKVETKRTKEGEGLQRRNIEDAACFVREFRGQDQGHIESSQSQGEIFHAGQSQQAFFGLVSSPTQGVHKMKISHLTLEVLSGEITTESTDFIVNSSNDNFSLKRGVSKAILDAAGPDVMVECAQLGSQPHSGLIVTRSGNLPCGNIVHTMVQGDPANIRAVVLQVLQVCEQKEASSVAFPALGTGQGGVRPSLVAEAMISAVADFVKKSSQHLKLVKIIIFQQEMVPDFHKIMKKMEGGDPPVEKNVITKMKEKVGNFFTFGGGNSRSEKKGFASERVGSLSERTEFGLEGEDIGLEGNEFGLQREGFAPAVFELCGENSGSVWDAGEELERCLMNAQTERMIREPGVALLIPWCQRALQELQSTLTVHVRLESEDGQPCVRLEGLTRDVSTAESHIRHLISEAEEESRRREATWVSAQVEWQYKSWGTFMPFDLLTNLALERAYQDQQALLSVLIEGVKHNANLPSGTASARGKVVQLRRRDL